LRAPKVSLVEGPREYVATDYERVLNRWTRTEQLFVATELTMCSPRRPPTSHGISWAYVVRYAEDYRLTVDQRSALFDRSLRK
jgi:hypothetical protein